MEWLGVIFYIKLNYAETQGKAGRGQKSLFCFTFVLHERDDGGALAFTRIIGYIMEDRQITKPADNPPKISQT